MFFKGLHLDIKIEAGPEGDVRFIKIKNFHFCSPLAKSQLAVIIMADKLFKKT